MPATSVSGWQGRESGRLRVKIIWIAATLDLDEAVCWGRSAGSVAVGSWRVFASDLKAEWPARAVGAVVGIAASGPLVGRVAELAVLNEAIGRAGAGSVQVVAISGEGGIGKSRLALEGLRSADARGFRTLESAAGRLQRDLSYAPIVEALRPLVAEAALVDGLSDLARLFDGIRVPPLVALGDAGLERTRMFEAVRILIERASIRGRSRSSSTMCIGPTRAPSRCCTMWYVVSLGSAACSSSPTVPTRPAMNCVNC